MLQLGVVDAREDVTAELPLRSLLGFIGPDAGVGLALNKRLAGLDDVLRRRCIHDGVILVDVTAAGC